MVLKVQKEMLRKIQNLDSRTPEIVSQGVVHMENTSVHNSWSSVHQIWEARRETKIIESHKKSKSHIFIFMVLKNPLMYFITISERGEEKWLLTKADLSWTMSFS